jgi:hypothetical protein
MAYRGAFLIIGIIGAIGVACVPSTPFDPLAVRMKDANQVEVVYVPCEPVKVGGIEVIFSGDKVFDDSDQRVWRVEFASGQEVKDFVLGRVPPGASETVRWQGLESGKTYVVAVLRQGGDRDYQDFSLSDLVQGRVRFQDRNMTMEQFEKRKSCN